MPELPEVETIRRDLEPLILGRTIESVTVLRPSVVVTPLHFLHQAVSKQTIEKCRRHGKVLIFELAGGYSLLIHLRMTGRIIVCDDTICQQPGRRCRTINCSATSTRQLSGQWLPKYARVVFDLNLGSRLVYDDCRALGILEVCVTHNLGTSRTLRELGPDALEEAGLASLVTELPKRRLPIKCLLLDQRVIAGIGNIYASEICYAARIHPEKAANTLTSAERRNLGSSVQRVLTSAIAARGTTFSDYRTGQGDRGNYASRLRVYGREGQRCHRRNCNGTIVRIIQQQRSTYYCPQCQR
ncbi:MAG: bifunctional DNA-formamidopyrimidine glycosylase/DNA-(apurinic or apyrimidinic site) lyase [Candidatus Zipacnadales bacterium]